MWIVSIRSSPYIQACIPFQLETFIIIYFYLIVDFKPSISALACDLSRGISGGGQIDFCTIHATQINHETSVRRGATNEIVSRSLNRDQHVPFPGKKDALLDVVNVFGLHDSEGKFRVDGFPLYNQCVL